MRTLPHIFEQNREWADKVSQEDPDFFERLAQQQNPEILWIGCSDSRVPANQIINQPPGEVFVHRNIANVVVHTDLNCLSVIQYAVEVLKVKHIIVCGHYGCGGVRAAMGDEQFGLIDNWLMHIKDVARLNQTELDALPDDQKFARMCELNVLEQLANVRATTIVQNAWKNGQDLTVHGWIYDVKNGILKDLEISSDH